MSEKTQSKATWTARDLPDMAFVVFGAGRSGMAASRLLRKHGARVILTDDHEYVLDDKRSRELSDLGVEQIFGGSFAFSDHDVDGMVLSPGIPPSHPLVKDAVDRGLPVISEVECGSRLTDRPIVAVTGTNGKTTTTALITHILKAAGQNAISCGNIGTALSDVLCRDEEQLKDAVLVLEVSSFQLELIDTFHPKISVILNLSPDHADRHPSLDEYLAVKARIMMNQGPGDYAILNADDIKVWRLSRDAKPQVWGFSRRFMHDPGINVVSGNIMINEGGQKKEAGKISDIKLPGRHNEMNVLAAVGAANLMKAPVNVIDKCLSEFEGVEHRIELVEEFRGIRFYNDSKATNLDATTVAIKSFNDPIVLICGGRGKGDDYKSALPLLRDRVKSLIVMGEAAPQIMRAWSGQIVTRPVYNMSQAVERSFECAIAGDVVLFSPACSSFDMYKSYEERGRDFKRCVKELIKNLE